MSQHTPGPWARNIPPAEKYPIYAEGSHAHVAVVLASGIPKEEREANCNLIAAAPELLAALKDAAEVVEAEWGLGRADDWRALIARAEGRKP